MTRFSLALVLLVGCGADPEPADDEASGAAPVTEQDVVGEEVLGEDDSLRAPSGAPEVDCSGPPDDPMQIDLFTQAAADGDLGRAITGLESLAGAHPSSSTARVRLGELMLRARPPRAAEAHTWFVRALALHEQGCELGYRDRWAALEGRGLSQMMQGDYEAAEAPLRESLRRWPGSRSTHYNLACVLCQTGDLDGCERELGVTLGPLEAPDFLGDQTRPESYYRNMVQRDSDLAPLRADAERLARVLE